jgi:putative ABC transport system permease protein
MEARSSTPALARPVFPHAFAQSAQLAWWSVLRHRRRTLVAILAVAFGTAALILAQAFIEWIFWATREGTIQGGLGHIHVSRQGFQKSGRADLARFVLPDDSPVRAAIARLPEVVTVAPRLYFSGLASHGDATLSFVGEGVDPQSENRFGEIDIVVRGENLSPSQPKAITMGEGLAANLGVAVGDTVVLLATTKTGGVGAVEAPVRGLFATVSKAYDDSAVRVPLAVAHELLHASGAHEWVVVLRETDQTPAVLAALRARFAGDGLEFVPWYDLADFYNKTVTLLDRQMGLVKTIMALIIVLTIGNSMMMGVMERTSEIGTALALGTRRRGILSQFVLEGVLLGVVGGLAGVAIGVALAHAVSAIGIPMPPPPGQARGYRAGMIVTSPAVVTALAIAVATALVAALYPAWKASRTRVVDALRHNR